MKLRYLGCSSSRMLHGDTALHMQACTWRMSQSGQKDGGRALSDRWEVDLSHVGAEVLGRIRLNFYDQTIQKYAELPIHRLTIHELMSSGHKVNNERLIAIAQHVQRHVLKFSYRPSHRKTHTFRCWRTWYDLRSCLTAILLLQSVHAIYHRAFAKLVDFPKVVNVNHVSRLWTAKVLVCDVVMVGRTVCAVIERTGSRRSASRSPPSKVQLAAAPLPERHRSDGYPDDMYRGIYEASLRVSTQRLNCNKFLADMIMVCAVCCCARGSCCCMSEPNKSASDRRAVHRLTSSSAR
eukprot:759473-Hanusia_phi.AAC.2